MTPGFNSIQLHHLLYELGKLINLSEFDFLIWDMRIIMTIACVVKMCEIRNISA